MNVIQAKIGEKEDFGYIDPVTKLYRVFPTLAIWDSDCVTYINLEKKTQLEVAEEVVKYIEFINKKNQNQTPFDY